MFNSKLLYMTNSEKVFLSHQQVFFNNPIFTENFQQNNFCKQLKQKLQKTLQINNEGNEVFFYEPLKNSKYSVKVIHLLQTKNGLGVITSIRSPFVNGMYFYHQGDNFLSLMVDPCVEKVKSVISGHSIPLNNR